MEILSDVFVSFETAKLAFEKGFESKIGLGYKKPQGNYYVLKTGEFNGNCLRSKEDIQSQPELKPSAKKYFQETISAPTQSLLQAWLRKYYNIDITIFRSFTMNKSYHYIIMYDFDFDHANQQESIPDRTYEQALEEALKEALLTI